MSPGDRNHAVAPLHILKLSTSLSMVYQNQKFEREFDLSSNLTADSRHRMVSPAPTQILIGISLNPDKCKELLSWATRILAHPNDTIVAIHVLVSKEKKKHKSKTLDQSQFRRAKAYVISLLGEFARTCQSKQVNLEAKVGFSTSVGRGLIEEAKAISADFLLVGGSRKQSHRTSWEITRYCFENAPEECSVVSIGKSKHLEKGSDSNSEQFEEFRQLTSRWNKNTPIVRGASSVQNLFISKTKREKPSPTTVLDGSDGESHSTEEDSFSFGDSSITESPPPAPKLGGQSNKRKQILKFKLFSSFLCSSFDLHGRKIKGQCNNDKQQPLLRCFSYEEISKATKNFHPDNMVGRGGYSEVYRGDLYDGQTIAVKRLAKDNTDPNKEKEFLMELGIIGHVCHPNTASLVGCCIENGLHLIFNFYPNGTVASALHSRSSKSMEWPVRYKIAIGVARGLHYLHKCCKHRIIHRDIKASNVLLGPDYEPQITDFGLAKWLPNKWTHHAVIPIEGTFGYLAPEYFMHGIVDEKTDVFAFGVLLLEIITGRTPVDSSKQNLLQWAKPLMESGDVAKLADPKLEGKYDMDQMRGLVLTASYCVRQSSIRRPSMTEVLELLSNGHDSEIGRSWRMPKYRSDVMDDYSMDFGYDAPTDFILEDI